MLTQKDRDRNDWVKIKSWLFCNANATAPFSKKERRPYQTDLLQE